MPSHSILWRRLDLPGLEIGGMNHRGRQLALFGTVLLGWKRRPCVLSYSVETDREGRTRRGHVEGWMGNKSVKVRITADSARRWRLNGEAQPGVEGCDDVDLSFSPSTNSLPILRLGLARGERASIRAAWLRFPDFSLRPLSQVYRRTGSATYRYESSSGFSASLTVNRAGFVTRYGRAWRAVGQAGPI
jgi:uncharacterized protein